MHLSKPQFKVCHVDLSPKPIVYIVEMQHLTEVPFVMKLHAHLTAARAASHQHLVHSHQRNASIRRRIRSVTWPWRRASSSTRLTPIESQTPFGR